MIVFENTHFQYMFDTSEIVQLCTLERALYY